MPTPSDLHPHHEDHPDNISRNARRGLFLFVIYFALYIGFLLLNVFAPEVMAKPSFNGISFSVTAGIGLIFAAFLLALIYMRVTRLPTDRTQ